MLRGRRAVRRSPESRWVAIRAIIAAIPRGRVATYGQVAAAAGFPRGARLTARALQGADGLPWQRVVAAGGRIALSGVEGQDQRIRLRGEGVRFRGNRVRMDLHGWGGRPPTARQRTPAGTRVGSNGPERPAPVEARGAMRVAFERELQRLPGLERRTWVTPQRRRAYVSGDREIVRVGPGRAIAVRLPDPRDGTPFPDRGATVPSGGRPRRGSWRSVRLATTDDLIAGLALVEAALLESPGSSDRRTGGRDPRRPPGIRRTVPRSMRVVRR